MAQKSLSECFSELKKNSGELNPDMKVCLDFLWNEKKKRPELKPVFCGDKDCDKKEVKKEDAF